MLSKRESIGLVSLITCLIMVYGVFEAYQIKAETVTIRSSKIPVKAGPIRIVMITDVHMGPMLYPGRLPPMIKMIEKARPDILISGGDLVDGYIYNETEMAAALKHVPAPLGKFAVIGNHEVYEGLLKSIKFTRDAGFTLLRNQSVAARKDLVITGVDDPAIKRDEASPDEDKLLETVPQDKFSLLLKHRPHVDKENLEKIDLQLSGHTHQGQIFPFEWVVRLSYPLGHGLRQIAPGRHIYTSRGTGTWGPPIRVLAPPEITIIDLIPAKDKSQSTRPKAKKKGTAKD
jgi:predicted MPP superfamily phosphohydrolase